MVKRHISNFLKENPLVIPAAVLALAAYSGFFRINPQHQYRTVFPSARVGVISGTVVENPTKVSGYKNAYRVKIRLNSVGTADGAQGYASGIVETYVPTSLYEIHSPGKLYSAWSGQKQDFLIDCGAKVEFKVVPKSVKNYKDRDGGSKTEFHVTDIRKCDWKCDENSSNEIPFGKFSAAEKLKYAFEKFLSRAAKIRALSRLHFSRLMYAWGNAGGLVLALLSGSREYLPPEAGEAFRNAGLSHILALSGMHLSLFSGLAFFIGKKSLGKRFAPILEIFAVLLFFWFAGKSPSLFRALLFSICATVSALTHKKSEKQPEHARAVLFDSCIDFSERRFRTRLQTFIRRASRNNLHQRISCEAFVPRASSTRRKFVVAIGGSAVFHDSNLPEIFRDFRSRRSARKHGGFAHNNSIRISCAGRNFVEPRFSVFGSDFRKRPRRVLFCNRKARHRIRADSKN